MSLRIAFLLGLIWLSGCMTRSAEGRLQDIGEYQSPTWLVAVCDTPLDDGHCDLTEGASQNQVDISDNAFYVTVLSVGRGEVPVVMRLHKQKRDAFEGQSMGQPGRRVRVSPSYQMDDGTTRVTHKFEVPDGVLQDGESYIIVVESAGEELYAPITAQDGGIEATDNGADSNLLP